MKTRYLCPLIKEFCFPQHKMAFISGPRQCGKTTLAKSLLKERHSGNYYNWDETKFRRLWTKNPSAIIPTKSKKTSVVVLDEIHKAKLWKRTLKGVFDTLENPLDIIVTGSARLNVYKKGSDSLLGRYFHFRLHPFTLGEISNASKVAPDIFLDTLFNRSLHPKKQHLTDIESLLQFSGFPEPFLSQDTRKTRIWRNNRVEMIIRHDLRDLTRIPELSQVEMLASLLPEKVGSPLSLTSLREDLEISFQTVRRWLNSLKELYYLFEVKPYHTSITRSLKKEGKIYLWDYSEILSESHRFENLVACHLLKTCHYWTDSGEGDFRLTYLRNKEKQEIDFLILRDEKPWLPVEVKLNETTPASNWKIFFKQIPCKRALQIVRKPQQWKLHSANGKHLLIASAHESLAYFS